MKQIVLSNCILTMASLCSGTRAFGSLVARRVSVQRGVSKAGVPFRRYGSRFPLAMSSTTEAETKTESTTNPLLDQDGLPKFQSIEPSNLTPAVNSLLEKLDTEMTVLEESLSPDSSYEEVLPAVERMQDPLSYAWGVAGHLNGVKNGEELRQAYEENQGKVVQAMTKFSQSRPLYDALSGIASKPYEGADEFEISQKQRAVDGSLRAMTLGGVGLEGEAKERFNAIKLRLAELGNKFNNNILDSTKAFSLTLKDASIMASVPSSAKAMWSNSHYMHLMSEAGEGEEIDPVDPEQGPWRVTLDGPSYIAAMSHLPDSGIREEIYEAFVTRASDSFSERDNVPLIYEILSLKLELARLLGFNNYAELSLTSKMAPSVQAVTELSDMIAEKAQPAALKELEEITAMAKEIGGGEFDEPNLELMPWDISYFSERLKEKKFDITAEELRPYFALPAVLDGMFQLVNRIFNVEVKAADGEAEVWHPDVRFFNVYDVDSGEHIASFYLDPYSRPQDKRGGAWMDVCIGKSEALSRSVPVAYLTCNGSPPIGDTPSLMTFGEVETLFHEFGHGLQHMLTRAKVGDVAGINGVEWDAVELPSQFMENWCYDRPTVYSFAKHYETGEALPEEMFEKLKQQKTFNVGMLACRQLVFGMVDLELHSYYDPESHEEGGESVFDVYKRMSKKYAPHAPVLQYDRFLCAFQHIFSGGYAAGYYSYKWAEVMSADAFGAFEDVGLDNEEEVKKVGLAFRDTVLSLGGGVDPSTVFKRFRGRDPNPEALLRQNGLA